MAHFAALRTALLPAFPDIGSPALETALTEGGPALEAQILRHQLGPLWHARTQAAPFAESRVTAAKVYLRQLAAQREIDDLFERNGITYAVFKGAAIRELIFDEPAIRLCSDIDILVAPGQRAAAARVLVEAGYRLVIEPSVVSHEVVLARDLVAIDLHWELLRPGRIPASMTGELLSRRQRQHGRWTLSETDALFVILVHPALSKHLSTSQMGLHRIVDIVRWLQRIDVDWQALGHQLRSCGLKTAAWTMLSLVRLLSPATFAPVVDGPLQSLRPGRLRAAYLRWWLNQDLSARLARVHPARLLGLSLFLHDRPSQAWHALRGWQRSHVTRQDDSLVFSELVKPQHLG